METFQSYDKTIHLFENCLSTADFSRKFNNLFDVFNSKKDRCDNVFKSPINNDSKEQIFSFLNEVVEYIKHLKAPNGKNILKSRRKTGFMGFMINIHNLKEIYEQYAETKKIISIPTQHLNQDPLENFFGRIRSCLGSNTNPTVTRTILRKLS